MSSWRRWKRHGKQPRVPPRRVLPKRPRAYGSVLGAITEQCRSGYGADQLRGVWEAVMGATKRSLPALFAAAGLLAHGVAWTDTPEMFGCSTVGRDASTAADGSVTWHLAPDDMARWYMTHCDLVAVGRFSAVTVKDYDQNVQMSGVEALFAVDEVLLGADVTEVKVRISEGMLVQPGETVSRNTARNVYRNDKSLKLEWHQAVVDDLRDLHRTGAALDEERLAELERLVGNLGYGRLGRIDRATELEFAHRNIAVGWGTTFYLEGGAIHPDTPFLLGLDAEEHRGHDQLTPIYTLLHWGDYAVTVADAIRAAVTEQASPAD